MKDYKIVTRRKNIPIDGAAQPELVNEEYKIRIQEESDIHATDVFLHRDPVFNAFCVRIEEKWRGKDELVKFLNELAKSIDHEFDN